MEKKQINSIDGGRLVMALLVLTYHCRPWDGMHGTVLPRILSLFTGIAVSYFFLVSGFFLFRGMEFPLCGEDRNRLVRTLGPQLRLYLIWSLIYLPLSIYGEITVYQRTPLRAAADILWGTAVLGRNYLSWHLWYLMALMVSEIFIFLLIRAGLRERGILCLSAVFFIAGRILDVLSRVDGFPGERLVDGYFAVFGSTYNALFSGFFYVSFGFYMARRKAEVKKAVLGLGVTAFGVAAYLFYGWRLVSSILLAGCIVSLFLWILKLNLADSPVFPFLKEMSRMVYLVHMLFYGVFTIVIAGGDANPVDAFLFTLVMTLLYSAAEAWYKGTVGKKLVGGL